mmetsp:Transcript_126139/g.315266  ORF Transcript_126139/g.315266 Transcript_126139/m.315266 type:complete len:240 (-) Transcript_126139:943-1662(-)
MAHLEILALVAAGGERGLDVPRTGAQPREVDSAACTGRVQLDCVPLAAVFLAYGFLVLWVGWQPGDGHRLVANMLGGGWLVGPVRRDGPRGLPGGRPHLARGATLQRRLRRGPPLPGVGRAAVPRRDLLRRLEGELFRGRPGLAQGTGDLRRYGSAGSAASGVGVGHACSPRVLRAGQHGVFEGRCGFPGSPGRLQKSRPPLLRAGHGRERGVVPRDGRGERGERRDDCPRSGVQSPRG